MDIIENGVQYFIVDVFTDVKYGGNQLAVFIDQKDVFSRSEMQEIAREFNFSEVAFIKNRIEINEYSVRIFTPEYEVPFAGHPVLGTAYVVAKYLIKSIVKEVVLHLPIGRIKISLELEDNDDYTLVMQQSQPRFGELLSIEEISTGLQLAKKSFNINLPIQQISTGLPYLIIPIKDLETMGSLKFDVDDIVRFLKFKGMHKSNSETGLSTSFFFFSRETYEVSNSFNARMFCLENGKIIEDSATGSANGCFLAFLLKYERREISAVVEQGFQMNRKSYIKLEGDVKDGKFKIMVGGKTVPISQGKWLC